MSGGRRTYSIASKAPQLVADGKTMIHKHPDRDEIIEACAMYALDPPNRRCSLKDFEHQLEAEFNIGLSCNGEYIKKFIQRYIHPVVVVEDKWVREGIMNAATDLNIPKRKLQVADRLERRFEQESRNRETSPAEVASLGRAVLGALGDAEDSLERFQMYPSKKEHKQQTNVEVDLKGVLEQMMGKSPETDDKTVDVDSTVLDDED